MSNEIYAIPLKTIDGQEATLKPYQGKVALIVNVASKCGLTKQYDALEKIYETYRDRGFTVLGFPSNEFAGQEPGSEQEIQEFCRTTFGVQFPMFSKIEVNGANRHPLYQLLIREQPKATGSLLSGFYSRLVNKGRKPAHPEDILWNFEKFLVARDGRVIQRFSPDIAPDDSTIVDAIEAALAK
ncbi:glutathione peroxidase [Brenneria goodwinii]|uniref:Thioredoxin/glutathione peroxidase BtuE n=1 Tax=Brenneria goodwinii TaxID=1109412 RepID=A0A0G4JZG1_9GAMM|nr:glutathione peroxidase [Brenneria goodwinii]ATA23631.1 glutathione peroxidase [Brenneria goodwinii]MCG8154729.1 glutathione peroxidase [Brenneria goodwinii]MCG8159934.1 glutathione peroxidase [Brenneria goodwinii]MCG8163967.1 glutathione peroxidase [Brenneria goodwinii]MCG8168576.1 glutathione peroxidase [Brenneria goodwinii]